MRTEEQKADRRRAKVRASWGERTFYALVVAAVVSAFVVGFVPRDSRDFWIYVSWVFGALSVAAMVMLLVARADPALEGSTTVPTLD